MKKTVNAKVIKNFNVKKGKNNYDMYFANDEKKNKIMDMPIERFEYLKSKGYVVEYKESTPKKSIKAEEKKQRQNNDN